MGRNAAAFERFILRSCYSDYDDDGGGSLKESCDVYIFIQFCFSGKNYVSIPADCSSSSPQRSQLVDLTLVKIKLKSF